jgi:two-component system LytT family sensor kinase
MSIQIPTETVPPGGLVAKRGRLSWWLYGCVAILYSVYLGLNSLIALPANSHFAAWEPLFWEASSVPVVFALLPLVVWFESRHRIDSRPRGRIIALHAAAAVVFSVTHTTLMTLIRVAVYAAVGDHYNSGFGVGSRLLYEGQKDLVTYLIALVGIFAVRQFRIRRSGEIRAAQLSAELSQARLRHLTTQIEPHFLFNTLNAISNRMHEDVDAADRMIAELGSLLRAAYDTGDGILVPLGTELKWLGSYAAMMTERFRGLLRFELEVGDLQNDARRLATLQVPRLLLQPLVENALRHGLADGRGTLRVDVRYAQGRLHYAISDDGVGVRDPVAALDAGTGLSNVRRRLEILYPDQHTFTLERREPRGTLVLLTFPAGDAVST